MKEMNLGRILIENRHKRGITQDELASHIGVSKELFPNGKPEFPIVKDTTPQTHAYITSRTLNFGGTSHETTDFL